MIATGRLGLRTKWKKNAIAAGTSSCVATVDGSQRKG
jgi:hypothetical protein